MNFDHDCTESANHRRLVDDVKSAAWLLRWVTVSALALFFLAGLAFGLLLK